MLLRDLLALSADLPTDARLVTTMEGCRNGSEIVQVQVANLLSTGETVIVLVEQYGNDLSWHRQVSLPSPHDGEPR